MGYFLYGVELKVERIRDDELLVLEDLHYIKTIFGSDVYVLQSILPEKGNLVAHELHSGVTAVLPIEACRFHKARKEVLADE